MESEQGEGVACLPSGSFTVAADLCSGSMGPACGSQRPAWPHTPSLRSPGWHWAHTWWMHRQVDELVVERVSALGSTTSGGPSGCPPAAAPMYDCVISAGETWFGVWIR